MDRSTSWSLDPEAAGGVALGVEVDDEDPLALLSEIGREVDHRGGLPDAALLVGTGDRLAHQAPGRRVLTSVNSTIWRPFSLSRAGVRRGAADPDSRRSPDAHRRASWSPQTPCVVLHVEQSRSASRSIGPASMLAIPRTPAALQGPCERRLGSTWNTARRDAGLRADRAPDEAGQTANPTSCCRGQVPRVVGTREADGRMFHLQHAPAWKWPVSPIGTASVYSCTT